MAVGATGGSGVGAPAVGAAAVSAVPVATKRTGGRGGGSFLRQPKGTHDANNVTHAHLRTPRPLQHILRIPGGTLASRLGLGQTETPRPLQHMLRIAGGKPVPPLGLSRTESPRPCQRMMGTM